MQTKEARVTYAEISAQDYSAFSSPCRYSVPFLECHQLCLLIAIAVAYNAFRAVIDQVFVLTKWYLTAGVGRFFSASPCPSPSILVIRLHRQMCTSYRERSEWCRSYPFSSWSVLVSGVVTLWIDCMVYGAKGRAEFPDLGWP